MAENTNTHTDIYNYNFFCNQGLYGQADKALSWLRREEEEFATEVGDDYDLNDYDDNDYHADKDHNQDDGYGDGHKDDHIR